MLGRLEAQTMLRLQIEHFEFQHRIEIRPTTLRAVDQTERFTQNRPKQLKIDDLLLPLQWIALLGKLPQAILDAPKPSLPRQATPPAFVGPNLDQCRAKGEVSESVRF